MCSVWWPCWPVQYIRVTKSYTNRPIIASKLTGNIKPTSEPAQHLGVQTKLLIVLNWVFSLETNLLILFLYRLYLVQYTFSFESNFQLLCASATIPHSAAIGALSPHTRCYLKTLASMALFCSAQRGYPWTKQAAAIAYICPWGKISLLASRPVCGSSQWFSELCGVRFFKVLGSFYEV